VQLRSLVKTGLLRDVVSLFDKAESIHYLATQTGAEVCGHPTIVHGGVQGMLCDEVFAGLIYGMKRQNTLPAGPAVTANLSVNFRKVLRPMPRRVHVLNILSKRQIYSLEACCMILPDAL
jgi:hypothetical protein